MAENSKISWTTHTFNPWHGCTKVSAGCKNCYAEVLSKRFGRQIWGPKAGRKLLSDAYWLEPRKWNDAAEAIVAAGLPRPRVFCASMADVFEGPETCQNPEAYAAISRARQKLFGLIYLTPNLDWLLLTKRPHNVLGMVPDSYHLIGFPPNVWVGTSLENQDVVLPRLSHLAQIPAVVRFVSAEPLIGPLDLTLPHFCCKHCSFPLGFNPENELDLDGSEGLAYIAYCQRGCENCGSRAGDWAVDSFIGYIDWLIVGGESGHGARPMHPDWARSLRDQAGDERVAFHFKQWGQYLPYELSGQPPYWETPDGEWHDSHGLSIIDAETCEAGRGWHPDSLTSEDVAWKNVGKEASGRLLDGRTWDEFPTPQLDRVKGASPCAN